MCLLSCVLCVRVVWCAGSLFANWPNCGKYEWHGVVISAGCGLLSTLYRFLIRLEWALQSRAGVLIFTFFGTNTMGSIRKWWCCSVVREFTLRWLYPNKQSVLSLYYLTPDVTQPSSCGIECYPSICLEFIGSTKYKMLGLEIVTKPCISISTAPSAEIVWLKSDTVDHSSCDRSCYDKVVWVKQVQGTCWV